MRALVIANGEPPGAAFIRRLADGADIVLCADGGAAVALEAKVRLDCVVGDLDSLDEATVSVLCQRGVSLHRFPMDKDETDLELTLLQAVARGADTIDVVGVLGGRADQMLANVLLLALPALKSVRVRLLDEAHEIQLVDGQATIQGRVGEIVSLVPIAGDAIGVQTDGLEWPLNDSTLAFGAARGISNRLAKPEATVKVKSGLLLAIRLVSPSSGEQAGGGE